MNRMYLGEYHYGDVVIPDGVPRIIPDDLFEEVQKRFVLNKHKDSIKDMELVFDQNAAGSTIRFFEKRSD